MKVALHLATLLMGIALIAYGGLCSTRPVEVWSEFKAFAARVAGDPATRHALGYGGEREGTDFDYLLSRVWGLSDDWPRVIWAGMALCGVGGAGAAFELAGGRRRRAPGSSP